MSRHARERNPEIRKPEVELPLFAEQNFYKFEQTKSCLTAPLSAHGESGDCRSLSGTGSPRDVARARRSDPQTSHAAGRSVVNLGRTRDAILWLLKTYGPLTDGEIEVLYVTNGLSRQDWPKRTASGLRSRRKELCDMGFVEDSGKLGKTLAKRDCTIWRLTPVGEQK